MVSTIYVSYAFSDSIEGIIHGQNSGIVGRNVHFY